MNQLALLNLLNLVSPALPIGAYSWSQGLEYAIEDAWVSDEKTLQDWLTGILSHSLGRLDIPVLLRCHANWDQRDLDAFSRWNRLLLASRESHELHQEDTHTGAALIRLMTQLSAAGDDALEALAGQNVSLVAAFALAAASQQIPAREAALGFLWSWSENQVAAAIKLIPLGQTAGQRVLAQLKTAIPEALALGLRCEDQDIGSAMPGLALASALHETQYSRMFRS